MQTLSIFLLSNSWNYTNPSWIFFKKKAQGKNICKEITSFLRSFFAFSMLWKKDFLILLSLIDRDLQSIKDSKELLNLLYINIRIYRQGQKHAYVSCMPGFNVIQFWSLESLCSAGVENGSTAGIISCITVKAGFLSDLNGVFVSLDRLGTLSLLLRKTLSIPEFCDEAAAFLFLSGFTFNQTIDTKQNIIKFVAIGISGNHSWN